MAVQLNYGYSSCQGIAGGLYDMSDRKVDSRLTEVRIKYGMGLVVGSEKGINADLPKASSTVEVFEGMALNGGTDEQDMDGNLIVPKNTSVSVLRVGRGWCRIAVGAKPGYGKKLFLITNGNEAGYFTTEEDTSTKIQVAGKYIGGKGVGAIAPIDLFDCNNWTVKEENNG